MTHNLARHEPSEACIGEHCHSCNLDEPPAPAYIVCGECGHVYRNARALRQAWRRTDLRTRWMANSGPGSSWRFRIAEIVFAVPLLVTVRAGRIYDCPKCGHDF